MKNAICMLIFGDELYVVGACLNAFVNRKFIDKLKLNIELVAMVDDKIYKYKEELEKYFDKIELINMIEIKLNDKYFFQEKYSKWMKYSINKWQFLKLTDYDKILFLDTDILPMNKDFYTIFNIRTPAFCSQGFLANNVEFPSSRFINESDNNFTMENCWNFSTKFKKSIDAGTVLVKPDKKLYEEFEDFIVKCAGKQGYYSTKISGVDETTLLLFYYFYKKIPVYSISYNYAILPFATQIPNDLKNIKAFNYMALVKPWVLLPMLQWPDQTIWHKIAKKALVKSKIITDLYVKYLFIYLIKLTDNLEYYFNNNKNNFCNLNGIKANRHLFNKILIILKTNKELDFDKQKQIMDIAQSIHKTMSKKSIVSFNQIENLINE